MSQTPSTHPLDQVAERVELLLQRYAQLQRTNGMLSEQVYALAQERLGGALRMGTRVTAIADRGDHVTVESSAGLLRAAMVFDARPTTEVPPTGVDEVALLQHFAGWEITASRPCFDPGVVEMMDFAVAQSRGLHFMYVLPFSPQRALVEATYISPATLPAAQ